MSQITKEEVAELIKDFKVQPLFNKVLITLNNHYEEGDLVLSGNVLSDLQYIIAKGGSVTQLDLGQKVIIDIEKLMIPVRNEQSNTYEVSMQVKIDPIEVDGQVYAIVEDRVIKAIDNR